MLLRSVSTPLLGSLLPSSSSSPLFFSGDSPASLHHHHHHHHHQHLQVSCHHSPVVTDCSPSQSLLRRTRSDGNLATLADYHSDSRSSSRKSVPTLGTNSVLDEMEEEEEEESDELGGGEINSFLEEGGNLALAPPPLFLARGLGIDLVGSGMFDSGDFCGGDGNGTGGCALKTDHGDQSDLETYYKKMVQENPRDPLFLRNYAAFLHQVKFDFQRAEEYYSRAILLDPNDGETLSKYASLIWEAHRDEERAASYFEQATKASPQNSFVQAAYAGFLWDTDCSEDVGANNFDNYSEFTNHLGEMAVMAT